MYMDYINNFKKKKYKFMYRRKNKKNRHKQNKFIVYNNFINISYKLKLILLISINNDIKGKLF